MIPYQTVVREKGGNRREGIVCPAAPGLEDEEGVAVVFPPSTVAMHVREDRLEIIGPENAVADEAKCGAGRGKRVCMFLTFADGALGCDRFSEDRWPVFFATRSQNRRQPTEAYPACQLPETE
ncbi:MAG: hypothetical protein HY566_00210 [Candidatus Kerfeldbacteria bacterium]|nr:hypothetical protein [Candidatus Kerfeldbacteria bacterium]